MAISSRSSGGLSLAALFVLLLSIIDFTLAAPLPQDSVNVTVSDQQLTKRGDVFPGEGRITVEEYRQYLRSWYPETDKYVFYTSGAASQIPEFQAKNPGYLYYDDFYNTKNPNCRWLDAFPLTSTGGHRGDDGEASSQAMGEVAEKKAIVFGAADYQTNPRAETLMYNQKEVKPLKAGIKDGRLQQIVHMEKDATLLSEVMATEDANGHFTYTKEYPSNYVNSGGRGEAGIPYEGPAKEGGSSVPYGNPAAPDSGRNGGTGAGAAKPAPKPAAAKPVPKPIKPPTHL